MSSYDPNMTTFETVVDGGVSSGVSYSAGLSASYISWGTNRRHLPRLKLGLRI